MINCSIITIGDELLIGQVVDTNSAWIAQQLNSVGARVKRRVAVGDIWPEIWEALDKECGQVDLVLLTGGLGPTADDITKPLLCEYFGGQMIVDKAALENVKYLFEKIFRRPITERNLKQAEVPDNCTVIQNKRGSAPGMLFEKNGTIFVSMPGVPHEMQGMMISDVLPLVLSRFNPHHIIHRTLVTFGIGESMLADLVQDFENALPPNVKLAYLPNYGLVRLRLTASGPDQLRTSSEVDSLFLELQGIVKSYMITNQDESMERIVGRMLKEKSASLATAESCTGGYIAHLLTAMPGSSQFYTGGVVSYSNQLKQDLLDVPSATLEMHGAVSDTTVRAMLQGILQKTGCRYGIAVSGIMGPDGGTEEKPVGTVWVAVGSNTRQTVNAFHFRFDRQRNIHMTAVNALNMLRGFLVEEAAG